MWCLAYSFPYLFVRLLTWYLLDWWVPMFPRRMSLLEVRMSCRLISSSRFQCYPWSCQGISRMLSIRPWFFFTSPCLELCIWWSISVSDSRSFQRPVFLKYIGVSFSIINFVFDLFILRPLFTPWAIWYLPGVLFSWCWSIAFFV